MPLLRFDLEDGEEPVEFTLNSNDTERFTKFMAECTELLKKPETIDRLRGQLQNCVNHLDRANRKGYGENFDKCIESANCALYETQ